MHEITFKVEGVGDVKITAAPDMTLLEAAKAANVAIDAPCNGNVSCGKCRVRLISGEVASELSHHIDESEYADGWRLACNARVTSDAEIFVPDIASAYKARMKTADLSSGEEVAIFEHTIAAIKGAGIELSSPLLDFCAELPPPTLDDTMPDNERLEQAIRAHVKSKHINITYHVLKKLPHTLRESGFSVRCAGFIDIDTFTLMDIYPASDRSPYAALAIDIGTTTVSAVLADMENGRILAKASSGNGQIRYGADVINRIIEQGKPGGIARLRNAVIKDTLVPLIGELAKAAGGFPAERILRLSIGANTTMNHLLMGVDAGPVRMEPYIPSFFELNGVTAGDLGLPAHPAAPVLIAPNIGSYVGGDITAGTLSSMLWNSGEFSLFIDLGTNGEIVFGSSEFMMSCACSAGPAFEGGEISCGMRATDGAIEKCEIDPATMEPTFSTISGAKPVGICGSGIIDIVAELYRAGIVSSKGLFKREGPRVARDEHGMSRYILARPEESGTGREVSINEVDLDCFIRAKGSIFSAIDTMLADIGMDVSVVERVCVAGGIGSSIDMRNAVCIGMFPDIPLDKFSYIGNSSLTGSYAMAISDAARHKVTEIARSMTYVELSTNPRYMDNFVAACFLPHTDIALFPSAKVLYADEPR